MAEQRQNFNETVRERMLRNRQRQKDTIELENIRRYRNNLREDIGDPEGSYESSTINRLVSTPREKRITPVPSESSGSMTMGNLDLPVREVRQAPTPAPTPIVNSASTGTMAPPSSPAVVPSAAPASAARNEVNAEAESRNSARAAAAARPNTRSRPSAARGSEMSADDLNALSQRRGEGEGSDTPSAKIIRDRLTEMARGLKKGGPIKKMAKGGAVKAAPASRRGDGCITKGKTKGRMV